MKDAVEGPGGGSPRRRPHSEMKGQGKGPSFAWSICELKGCIIRDAPVGEGDRSVISLEESETKSGLQSGKVLSVCGKY